MSLLVHPAQRPADDGTLVTVTPESAGWGYVGFEVARSSTTASWRGAATGSASCCVVVVAGTLPRQLRARRVATSAGAPTRSSGPPDAAYLPPGDERRRRRATGEVALCCAPAPTAARRARVLPAPRSRSRSAATGSYERTHPPDPHGRPARPTRCWCARSSRPAGTGPATRRTSTTATPCPRSRSWRRPTTTASPRRTGSACSASTPPTAPSTRASRCGDRDTVLVPARLPHGLGAARLRPLLPQRDGRPHPRLGHRQRPRPRMDAAMSTATTPSTRLLDNYVGGQWTPASGTDELDVTNPATGEVLARVPLSSSADLDAAVRAARAALPEWRAVSVIGRARAALRAARGPRGAQGGARALGDDRDGQDDRRRPRRGRAHDRDGRGRVRDPDDDAGPRSSRTSPATSTPRPCASRSACARRSCPSTSRRWCRSGSCPSPSAAATRSCSSPPSRSR